MDEAIAHYRKALMINPRHADAHANPAQALDKKGETREALESYLQSLMAGAWRHLHRARDPGYTKDDLDREFVKSLAEKMPEPEYVPPPKPKKAVTQESL